MALFTAFNGIAAGSKPQLIGTTTLTSGVNQTLTITGAPVYMLVKAWGGGGGGEAAFNSYAGGEGGFVSALVRYDGTKTYKYTVATGGAGGYGSGTSTTTGGVTGGGDGKGQAGAGGGYTGLFETSITSGNAIVIAAGGGGSALNGAGGDGGSTTGEDSGGASIGKGGTQSAGGAGSNSGSSLAGGGQNANNEAGGGSGYYGGGASSTGGGGGSCYSRVANTNSNLVRGKNDSDTNYTSGVAVGGSPASGTNATAGGRGELYIEFWTGDPYTAGLRS